MDSLKALITATDVTCTRNLEHFRRCEAIKESLQRLQSESDGHYTELDDVQRKIYRDTLALKTVKNKISNLYKIARENVDKCGFYHY